MITLIESRLIVTLNMKEAAALLGLLNQVDAPTNIPYADFKDNTQRILKQFVTDERTKVPVDYQTNNL